MNLESESTIIKGICDGLLSLKDIQPEYRTNSVCLAAVKRDGMYLKFVENQTEEICVEAVRQCPWALSYVKVRTTKIFDAVKESCKDIRNNEEVCNSGSCETIRK